MKHPETRRIVWCGIAAALLCVGSAHAQSLSASGANAQSFSATGPKAKTSNAQVFSTQTLNTQTSSTQDARDDEDSCQIFVQDFYNWYIAASNADAFKTENDPGWARTIRYKKHTFSPELVRAVEEDYKPRSKHPVEIVRFDAIVGTAEYDGRYVTGKVSAEGGRCTAEMFGIENGDQRASSAVSAELEFKDGRWLFVNFHYPVNAPANAPMNGKDRPDENLLAILNKVKEMKKGK